MFDMRRIMDLNPDGDADTNDEQQAGLTSNVKNDRRIGRHDNVFYSFGYRYVMPQVGAWVHANPGGSGDACGDGEPNFSYLSVDRSTTPDILIAGEYCNREQGLGRVAKWPLDGDTGRLRYQRVGDDDIVHTSEVYRLPETNLQASVGYFTACHSDCAVRASATVPLRCASTSPSLPGFASIVTSRPVGRRVVGVALPVGL